MKTAKPNFKAMITANRNVNASELRKSLKVLRDLEKTGLVKHTYSLERRKMTVASHAENVDGLNAESQSERSILQQH